MYEHIEVCTSTSLSLLIKSDNVQAYQITYELVKVFLLIKSVNVGANQSILLCLHYY